jgi:hypothetical protein
MRSSTADACRGLYLLVNCSRPGNPDQLALVRSANRALTWTAPRAITTVGSVGVLVPNNGGYLRTGDSLFSVATNPSTGRLYLAGAECGT